MERWRERGYVPDSEEEDEDLEETLEGLEDGGDGEEVLDASVRQERPKESARDDNSNQRRDQSLRSIGTVSESQDKHTAADGRKLERITRSGRSHAKAPIFEPDSSPDVLQFNDAQVPQALSKPTANWKQFSRSDDGIGDEGSAASTLSSLPSELGSLAGDDDVAMPDASVLGSPARKSQQGCHVGAAPVREGQKEDAVGDEMDVDQLSLPAANMSTPRVSPSQAPPPPSRAENRDSSDTTPRAGVQPRSSPVPSIPTNEPHNPPTYHGRALRPRTILQEKPYQVELARYALFCKQQGIPFHMPKSREQLREQQRRHGHHSADGEEESQEYVDVGNGTPDEESQESPVVPPSSRSRKDNAEHPRNMRLSRPSLAARLSGTGSSGGAQAHATSRLHIPKRRKLTHAQSLPQQQPSRTRQSRSLSLSNSDDDRSARHQQTNAPLARPQMASSDIVPEPSSPKPRKSMLALLNDLDNMDIYTSDHEGEAPTRPDGDASTLPARYHTSQGLAQDIIDLAASSDPENGPHADGASISGSGSGVSDSDSGSNSSITSTPTTSPMPESRELEHLQKRIKGVLPASWVRLEMKLQQEREKAAKERERKRAVEAAKERRARNDGKGVAQVIRRGTRRANLANSRSAQRPSLAESLGDGVEGDDSSSEELIGPANAPSATAPDFFSVDQPGQLNLSGFPLDDGDIPEDNRIDYMLPPVSRGPRTSHQRGSNGQKKKQSRLNFEPPSHPQRLPRSSGAGAVARPAGNIRHNAPPSSGVHTTWRNAASSSGRDPWHAPQRQLTRSESSRTSWSLGTATTPVFSSNTAVPRPRHQAPSGQARLMPNAPIAQGEQAVYLEPSEPQLPAFRPFARTESMRSAQSAETGSSRRPSKKKTNDFTARRGYFLNSGRRETMRPAGLENIPLDEQRDPVAFRAKLRRVGHGANHRTAGNGGAGMSHDEEAATNIAAATVRDRGDPNLNPQLQRFLLDEPPLPNTGDAVWAPQAPEPHGGLYQAQAPSGPGERRHRQQRRRKRMRQGRIDGPVSKDLNCAYSSHDKPEERGPEDLRPSSKPPAACPLTGLDTLPTIPTVGFDVYNFQMGTFFHSSTFIGSGEFARALDLASRQLDIDHGLSVIKYSSSTFRWGPWTESVASELTSIFRALKADYKELIRADPSTYDERKEKLCLDTYRSIITYISDKLNFLDTIDQKGFVDKLLALLSELAPARLVSTNTAAHHLRLEVAIRLLDVVLGLQVFSIATIGDQVCDRDGASQYLEESAKALIRLITCQAGQKDLQDILRENPLQEKREAGIRDDHPFASALVVLLTLEKRLPWLQRAMQLSRPSLLLPEDTGTNDVSVLERSWQALFTMLPFEKFDESGILVPDYRHHNTCDQWPMVNKLLAPVFAAYDGNVNNRQLDRYCRTLFHRCYHLVVFWGWQNWQDILQSLFRFFSKRKLRNLPSEGVCGSPAFLCHLGSGPDLNIEAKDSCFHMFLKTIGVSWQRMGSFYDKQKLHNFARRLIPLHERRFPRDQALHQQDLDELRNHHDLLCTLYWAIPEQFRFRLTTVQWLVQPLDSHTEACIISINSWLRLTRFKLSTDEATSGLEPFADWHSSFVKDMLKLHALARTEVERQEAAGLQQYSRDLVESVIEENQMQIETLLGTALVNLRLALEAAPSLEHGQALFEAFPLTEILDRFRGNSARASIVVCHVLDAVLAFASSDRQHSQSQRQAPVIVNTNDESQEFGDWAPFEELTNDDLLMPTPAVLYLDKTVRPIISRLLSRFFGDDTAPDDSVLCKVIDCWTSVGQVVVRYGLRQWSSYINQYAADSWASLPSTEQARKFTPCVLARIIEADSSVYSECKQDILQHWVTYAVERGSALKYQHLLTSALLNIDEGNPLLNNLPFSRTTGDKYTISLEEFSQRRLSMISSILSNMRTHHLKLKYDYDPQVKSVEDTYRGLIEAMMRAMKSNYQELGQGSNQAKGHYVHFVQRIVGFLQQHVQQICPLDSFFTDPKTFPLPADDPNYITAKLLAYEVKLDNVKVGKQLVTFIQSVAERATVDGQQDYLVDQLHSAMSQSLDQKRRKGTGATMVEFIIYCVLPGYVELSLKNPVAWILVRPFSKAVARVFSSLLFHLNMCDEGSARSVVQPLSFLYFQIDQSLNLVVDHPGLLDEPRILMTIISYLELIMASLPTINYIARSTKLAQDLISCILSFLRFANFAHATLSDPANAYAPDALDIDDPGMGNAPSFFTAVKHFATMELKAWLKDSWSHRDGRYYVRQGYEFQEVVVDPTCLSMEAVKPAFLHVVRAFDTSMAQFIPESLSSPDSDSNPFSALVHSPGAFLFRLDS